MRWIYLSPHFDDAVLSCGGLIFEQSRQGLQVEIWTIFAGDAPAGPLSPLALRCHADWGIPDVHELVAARREEDLAAAAIVGAEIAHFSLPDCIYRRSADGEPLYPDEVFVPFHPFDQGLDADIAAALAAELEPQDILVSPLAIGDHVDHRLARLAAERLDRPLRYYADIPYVFRIPKCSHQPRRGWRRICTLFQKKACMPGYLARLPTRPKWSWSLRQRRKCAPRCVQIGKPGMEFA